MALQKPRNVSSILSFFCTVKMQDSDELLMQRLDVAFENKGLNFLLLNMYYSKNISAWVRVEERMKKLRKEVVTKWEKQKI